jgi:cell division topological specificity factor
MSLLSFFFKDEKKSSATSARERLQIIIAHEHHLNSGPEFLPALHRELIGVISKYVNINPEDVKISLDRQGNLEVLDVNVVLPDARTAR